MDLIPKLEGIKEDVKEIDDTDILEAANIPKERAKLRKAELQAQAAAAKEPLLSTVDGTGVTCDTGQGPSWKVSGNNRGTPYIVLAGRPFVPFEGLK